MSGFYSASYFGYDAILRNMNAGYETDVIYLNYTMAFDKVDHKLLLQKLKAYGM